MSFKVIQAGFSASIQDLGRRGQKQYGVTSSGALDEISARLANFLLGNSEQDALLEIPYGQCQLLAEAETTLMVTGADLDFQINNNPAPRYQAITVRRGDQLHWRSPKTGVRAYMAVKGGFKTPPYFNSRATSFREGIGRALQTDDRLPFTQNTEMTTHLPIPQSWVPKSYDTLWLRLLPSYQHEQFSSKARHQLFNQTFTLGTEFDRTACRLHGQPIATSQLNMISEGMVEGAVQITHQGTPIIMLKEGPTIGGYPKIGTVFSLDLALLAQTMPGTKIRFKPISLPAAQLKRRAFEQCLNPKF